MIVASPTSRYASPIGSYRKTGFHPSSNLRFILTCFIEPFYHGFSEVQVFEHHAVVLVLWCLGDKDVNITVVSLVLFLSLLTHFLNSAVVLIGL